MKNYWKLTLSKSTIICFVLFNLGISGVFAVENPYMFPIQPGQQNYLSATMGEMRSAHFHAGIDIKTAGGTGLKVYAAADGYISRIKVEGGGYGNALYIDHPHLGTTTVYAHLQKYNEEIAEYALKEQYKRKSFSFDLYLEKDVFPVKKGDLVAFSGNSGGSMGPHLHFEIRDRHQRPINPLDFGFSEIKDNISPTPQRIGMKTMNINSRVDNEFGFFEFAPTRTGNEYTISNTIEAYGEIGISLMGYDRLNDASNKNGIPHLSLEMDDDKVIDFTINEVPFNKTRNVLCYKDYAIKASRNKSFQKLYVDDGNELDFYKTNGNRGIISIRDTLFHNMKITLKDANGNTSILRFKIRGSKPKVAVLSDKKGFKPYRHVVLDNTLMFMGKKAEHNGYFANIHVNHDTHELSSSYYVNDYSVYLWDLRSGTPDSIELCGEMIYPGLEMIIPSESEFEYFKPEFDLHFFTKTLFDTLYLKTDYIDELESDKEFFEISEDIYPLKRNLKITLKPRLNYEPKEKYAAYYTTDHKDYSFQGGKWIDNQYEFLTRTLGKYTLLPDTVPPEIKIIKQNSDHFTCYITDETSGIQDYELKINDQWVLMNYDPKNNYIWSEKLDKSKPFSGNLELKVRDNVNNENIYRTTIN